jgi:Fur family ferric uptake transcriptional regulator
MMNWQDKLNQEGLRLTHPRRVVISVLEDARVPLSPQTIHQRSLDAHEEIGLISVYRTLDMLTDLGLVRRVHGHDECQGYVLASPGHHHHMVCRNCAAAVEFSGIDDLSSLIDHIEEETGFVVNEHLLQFSGLCPQCQRSVCNRVY